MGSTVRSKHDGRQSSSTVLRRRLLFPVAAAVAVVTAVAAVPAGASPVGAVTGTGICFGFATAGGCDSAYGGTTTATAGSTERVGAALTATDGVNTDDQMVLDGSGTGISFSADPTDYAINNVDTATGCDVATVAVSDSGQTVAVTMRSTCAAASGQQVVVSAYNTVLPAAAGSFSLTLYTTNDATPVSTNSLALVAAPSQPRTPFASRGNQSITMSWDVPETDNGSPITGYDVYCSTTAPPSTADAPTATTDAATTTVTVDGLAAHTEYFCAVVAENAVGRSVPSAYVSARPYAPASAPQNFSTARGNGSVTLFWDQPADFGGTPITGYSAFCSTSYPPTVSHGDSCGHFGPAKRSGVVHGLTNGVTYYIGLTAVNAAGDSPLSGIGGPTPAGPPSRPWAVRVKPERRALVVRWKVPTSDGGSPITKYEVFCNTDDPLGPGGVVSATVTKNVARLTGLTSGTPYHCVVDADNDLGTSHQSPIVTATPL